MIRRLTCTTLAWLLLASSGAAQSRAARPALADPPPAAVPAQGAQPAAPPVPASIERMLHPNDGRPGYWLDEGAYTEALGALSLEAGYLEQLALSSRRVALLATEALELRLALRSTERARDELRAVVRSAEARRVAAERSRDAWYRAPILLLGTGVVLGAGLAVLLAFAVGGAS